MENEELKNKKHVENVNNEKAVFFLKICIAIFILSGITYVIGISLYNSFDFGLIFELISFIFTILAFLKIKDKQYKRAKTYIIIAMIPLGWLIIYDLFDLLMNLQEVLANVFIYYFSMDRFFYYLAPYLYDVTSVAIVVSLFFAYKAINRADGTNKNNNPIDSFYEKL